MAWASSEPPHFHLFHFLTHAIYGWIINRCMCDDQQNQSLKGSVNWSVDASRHSMDQLTCVSKRSNDWPDTERRCAPHGLLQLQVASCRTFCRHGRRRWGQFISLFFLSLKLTRSSPLFFTRALAFACIRSWAEPRCCLSPHVWGGEAVIWGWARPDRIELRPCSKVGAGADDLEKPVHFAGAGPPPSCSAWKKKIL